MKAMAWPLPKPSRTACRWWRPTPAPPGPGSAGAAPKSCATTASPRCARRSARSSAVGPNSGRCAATRWPAGARSPVGRQRPPASKAGSARSLRAVHNRRWRRDKGARAGYKRLDRPPSCQSTMDAKTKASHSPELIAEHGFKGDEYQRLLQILGREPTLTELGIFSVMWSEHCSYKSSRRWLRELPTKGAVVIQGPGENAGVIDLGDGDCAVFKMESHN